MGFDDVIADMEAKLSTFVTFVCFVIFVTFVKYYCYWIIFKRKKT